MRGQFNKIFILQHRNLSIGLKRLSKRCHYLFYDRDVFDLFFPFMSVEKMETRVRWREVEVPRKSALTSRPTALQTRFSRCSGASVPDEGRRSPRLEEDKTPSLLVCALLLRIRKVRTASLISGSLCPRCSGNAGGGVSIEPAAHPLLFIMG